MEQRKGWKWKLAQKLEYKWWQQYLKNKDVDGYLQWKTQYWQEMLAAVAQYMPAMENRSVLDAGCGPAGIFIALNHHQVDAIDPLLEKYRELPHFQEERFPWVRFRNLSLEQLDENGRYDIIYCLNAINHVNDLALCYDNLVRALKPGGYLVLSTDAHRNGLLKKIFQWLPGDMLHPVQLDIREYGNLLSERKMQVIKNIRYKREAIFDYYISIAKKESV
jgi:2-polyprenyl-3-methyl-5-hydroxy-6-metoxy-1,4-benzoquinol methylase